MNFLKHSSLRAKLITSFLFVGVVPLLIVGMIIWTKNSQTLLEQAEDRLLVLRESKASQIEGLFKTMFGQVKTLSGNRLTIEALKDFSVAFDNYVGEFSNKPSLDEVKASLRSYYTDQFEVKYVQENGGLTAPQAETHLSRLGNNGLALQYNYISNNSHPLGSKHLLESASDGTAWSKVHKSYHSSFRSYLEEFGYYDIFLIDHKGRVVYSVFKELDFATSLKDGPYSQSNFARVALRALNGRQGETYVDDLEPYAPSYEAPAGFLSSPIVDDGQVIGALVFQLPVDKIDLITTSNKQWKTTGFGKTGEAYIIGKDKKMRSVSRFLVETPEDYFKDIEATGIDKKSLDYIKAKNTTAIAQTVNSEGADSVTRGSTGFSIYRDYRNEKVLSSYKPLDIPGLEWYLLAESDESEALESVVALTQLLLLIGVIGALAVILFSWFFSTGISRKITNFVGTLREAAGHTMKNSGEVKSASQSVSSATTEQASAIQETVSTLNEITAMSGKSVEYAKQSTERAQSSFQVASEGKEAVNEMRQAMNEITQSNAQVVDAITQSNHEIKNVVQVIKDIAEKTNIINDIVFQTRLLSFNASVEAARAGEHGMGFAVVAEEVGNLAQMSGNAAKEIGDMLAASIGKVEKVVVDTGEKINALVESSRTKVESGSAIAKRCGEVLDEVVGNVEEVKSMMSKITSGSEEIAEGVSNISIAMTQLDETTHANADIAHKTLDFAEDLAYQAGLLQNVVKDLESTVLGQIEQAGHPAVEDSTASVTHLSPIRKKKSASSANGKSPMPSEYPLQNGKLAKKADYEDLPDQNDPRFASM